MLKLQLIFTTGKCVSFLLDFCNFIFVMNSKMDYTTVFNRLIQLRHGTSYITFII